VNSLGGGLDDTLAPVSSYAISASLLDMERSTWTLVGEDCVGQINAHH
jgi:hypothetical protein